MQPRVKKDDMVLVLSGKDKGKKSKVLRVFPKDMAAVVEKVNVAKRHQKRTRTFPGGIIEKSLKISLSKLMVICPHCAKPTRLNKKEGFRSCKRCGEIIDKGK
jgi:large subunit ribosomal protein L24